MAKMKSGVRSPTAHRTKEQAVAHGRGYSAQPSVKKKRAKRNAARAKLMKEGAVKKGDGKDVHHKKGMSNKRSNLTAKSQSSNRGHGKTRGKKPNKGK